MRSVQRATCNVQRATCDVRLLCSEEDMAEGGRNSSGPQGIFLSSKRTKSAFWAYCGYYKNAQDSWSRMAALPAGAARRKLLRGVATSPIYLLSLYDHHPQLFSECKVS